MEVLVQICIEGIGGLESKKGKNLIDILSGEVEQPSFFLRTSGTLGKNSIRFSTEVKRKRHQIVWQQTFYRKASGLRVEWDDQFVKDKSQIPVNKPRCGTVNDGKSKILFEFIRIDKFASDVVLAIAEINPIRINILNGGSGDPDTIRRSFDQSYPLQLQGSLVGDIGTHDLSLRASFCCVSTVIPIMHSLPITEDVPISFDIAIKKAKYVPIKTLKAAASLFCIIGPVRTNAAAASSDTLDPEWDETITLTLPMKPSISQNEGNPYFEIQLCDHRGSGIPDVVIGSRTFTVWDFFANVSKDKEICVQLWRVGVEGEPAPSDSRGFLVLHIMEPKLTHESANVFNNAYHEMAIKKLEILYQNSRSTGAQSLTSVRVKDGGKSITSPSNKLHCLLNGLRHLKCLIICCMEDCDDEKALLESEILVKMQTILASQDIGVEFCPIYFDSEAHSDPYLLRILVQSIFQCEMCIFVLGFIPGALVDQSSVALTFESDFDPRVDAWLKSHFSELEEREESLIEVLSHAAQFQFRENSHVTEKVLLFQRQLLILENKLPDDSDHVMAQTSTTEMARMKVYNAAAVDRIARRIASFGASCFVHHDAQSFVSTVKEQLITSIKASRLNGFRTHSLLNSSIFELQFLRSADVKHSKCHSVTETHAFKTIIVNLESCSSGNITGPMFVTSEDSLSSKFLYYALCEHMRNSNFRNMGSDVAKHCRGSAVAVFKPCFMYDFSVSAGSKASVSFLRALLQGLRAVLSTEPCILIDDIVFESDSTSSELISLVKPMLKATIEEYKSLSLLLSGIESLDPESLKVVLGIFPATTIPGLWICLLFGGRDIVFGCKMQSIVCTTLPCATVCAMVRHQSDTDAALVVIEECGIKHSSLGIVLQKFRHHPNLCSLASFLSDMTHAFSSCAGTDTTQMFIQLAQSAAASLTFADIISDILVAMHSVDIGPHVFKYLLLCSRSRYGLQPSDLIAISNVSSSVHVVCVAILRAIGACSESYCIVPFQEMYDAIDKVLATSADPRSAIRICDATMLKYFASMPVKWKIVENLIFMTEVMGEFGAISRRLQECSFQQYIVSNAFCSQDFRSFWLFFCKHPAGESISQRTRLLNHLGGVRAFSKQSCSSIVIATRFCTLISLYESANSILNTFKELYGSDLAESSDKITSDDWSRLCIVFALQGRLNLAWGRLDAAESILKETLVAHGSAVDADHVASDPSPIFDASKAVCGRLLSEVASILLVRGRNREALSFADKCVAFIEGIDPGRRSSIVSPSCVLDVMMCALEARLVNGLNTGAFAVVDSALKICDTEFGKFHPRSIAIYERLCSLNSISDNYPRALLMYESILKDLDLQRAWGFDVTGKLTTIILLVSDIFVANHEMSEAVAMCEQALAYRMERYGNEPNLQIARCLEKLAAARVLAKDPKNAAQDLRDALKIRQMLSGSKKDQDYFMCVLQLSGALKAAGYRSEARQHLKEWVEHLKEELGDSHEFVNTALDIIHSRMND